jgi:LPXTG-motif cell wall-anchored protein
MSMINRRNAVLGWAVWQVGKRAAQKKARDAVRSGDSRGPNMGAIAIGLAAVGGAAWFWRKRRMSDDVTTL